MPMLHQARPTASLYDYRKPNESDYATQSLKPPCAHAPPGLQMVGVELFNRRRVCRKLSRPCRKNNVPANLPKMSGNRLLAYGPGRTIHYTTIRLRLIVPCGPGCHTDAGRAGPAAHWRFSGQGAQQPGIFFCLPNTASGQVIDFMGRNSC